jgi:cell division transport system permease protein
MGRSKQKGPELNSRAVAWAVSHVRAFLFSLGKLYRAPAATIMTIAVIGIALALPSGLYLLLKNIETATAGMDQGARISLFLNKSTSAQEQRNLAADLEKKEQVLRVEVITRDQAFREFSDSSGFGSALEALDENPLPPVLVVFPALEEQSAAAIGVLAENLGRNKHVEEVILDMQWLQRLQAIMDTTRRVVLIISLMLALTVVLVVGNTIRLDIQNRQQEIEVAKLIGATDAFIRRPFLYGGLWYGLFGTLLGIIIVAISMSLIDAPVAQLAGLYQSSFSLRGLNSSEALWLSIGGILLGWSGSWLAVGKHIKEIEPS